MKKIYLLFSSAVLASLPIMAQEKPAATPDDPEVVFTQDFESDQEGLSAQEAWQQWQDEERGRITEITYYSRSGTGQVSKVDIYDGSDDWKIAGVRTDSIIILQNGVVPSNNEKDKANPVRQRRCHSGGDAAGHFDYAVGLRDHGGRDPRGEGRL